MKPAHALLAAVLLSAAPAALAAPGPIEIAVADPSRPAEDKARDADRKPAEMLAFAGVKPGMTVIDLMPGGGYFSRLFADVVGPKGKVIGLVPEEMMKFPNAAERLKAVSAGHDNIEVKAVPLLNLPIKGTADVVWTSQNYHDLHNTPNLDLVAFNKQVFAALKPGGVYVVLDHAAAAGTDIGSTNTVHRIDPAIVKREVLAAGFVFDGESKVLYNPADDHTQNVHSGAIRGHTDQFIYRFRKAK